MFWVFLKLISVPLCVIVLDLNQSVHASTDWDILIFTQHWPITVCMQWKEAQEHHSCKILPENTWTIHGIWPTKLGTGPLFCNHSLHFDPQKLEPIENNLLTYWPDIYNGSTTGLWKHEWNKHGTCAAILEPLDTEIKYFSKGLEWIHMYTMENILARAGINPDNMGYTPQQIWNAVKGSLGTNPDVQCVKDKKTGRWYLFEIRICFDKSLQLIDCEGAPPPASAPSRLFRDSSSSFAAADAVMSLDWGYAQNNGPATWVEKYPQAGGTRQSPVDIDPSKALPDAALDAEPLSWRYVDGCARALANTGYGWKVDVDGAGSLLKGGPLDAEYTLEQFHCHWGCNSDEGSEHTIGGRAYAGELHLVHWNSTKYSSFGEAASQPDGLAVLGILLQSGEANEELEKIVKRLSEVQHRGEKIKISDPINPVKFLPEETAYWTYLGSLTTPPCNESVIWILFKQAIEVSDEQLAAFRQLRCYAAGEECPCDELRGFVSLNYRPPLPLGERQLRESRVA